MSGQYVDSFGNRVKGFPRRSGTQRTRGWYRMRRYYPVQGSNRKAKRGPWSYFEWTKPISGMDNFTRRILGSYREVEFIGQERPAGAANVAYSISDGVALFLESF